ncbi:MAG TPA: GNAT family protein [Patescibacteria group bacterium]
MPRQISHTTVSLTGILKNRFLNHRFEVDEMSHIPGQTAAIRYFDENSRSDFEAVNDILSAKQVKHWMDDAGKISWSDYQYWAGKHTDEAFFFAVHDSRLEDKEQIREVRGFVDIFSGRSEKFLAKRVIKAGFVSPEAKKVLEVSLALRPLKNGEISPSGLMSSALRQSCLQVKSALHNHNEKDIVIFGFVDPQNLASARVLEAAGFVKKGKMKYDAEAEQEIFLYVLSWRKLQKKVKMSLEKALRNKMKVVMEPQITDSHCGPAVLKALLGFNHVHIMQEDVVNAMRIKSKIIRYGMRPMQLALAVQKLAPDLEFWFKQEASAKDLEKLIHQYKVPVGINWQGLFYDSIEEEKAKSRTKEHGHYSVVIDIDVENDQIMIDDPYSEYFDVPRIFSYKWFKTRWWDTDEIIDKKNKVTNFLRTERLIFVVTPSGYSFPEDMGMKKKESLSELEVVKNIPDINGVLQLTENSKEVAQDSLR